MVENCISSREVSIVSNTYYSISKYVQIYFNSPCLFSALVTINTFYLLQYFFPYIKIQNDKINQIKYIQENECWLLKIDPERLM